MAQPDTNSCKLDDIKRLLASNLDLVQSVLKLNEGRADCCSTEALIAALRKDNESMRQNVLDMNTKVNHFPESRTGQYILYILILTHHMCEQEWNRLKQFNSLTRRLRFYFDKSHELREGIIVSRSTLVSIEQAIVKLGIKKRGTLVDTVKFLANYYIEHNGSDDALMGAPPRQQLQKSKRCADSSDSDNERDCLSEVSVGPQRDLKKHKGALQPSACNNTAGVQAPAADAPGPYPFSYNFGAEEKNELDASVSGANGEI